MHEKQMHDDNIFITLTYNDQNLPTDNSLAHRDFQLFMKRLRKNTKKKIRFYMAGEYGENFERPHYHAILFGIDFPDKTFEATTPAGQKLYNSETLTKIWGMGHTSIGEVTFESCAYVARYIMKKITGDPAKKHYETVDWATGEIKQRTPEYNAMSRRKGIGQPWFDKYFSDVYPHDYVVINGHKTKPPKYYDQLLAKKYPFEIEQIKFLREQGALERSADNTDSRLRQREICTQSRLNQLKRNL